MEWAGIMGRTSRVFPLAVLTLVATGGYMVRGHWTWGLGWVQAGVVGAREGAGAKRHVARLTQAESELPNDFRPDRVVVLLGNANTGLALAIVAVMTLKPGVAASFGVLAAGWALGAYQAFRHLRAKAPATEESEAEAA